MSGGQIEIYGQIEGIQSIKNYLSNGNTLNHEEDLDWDINDWDSEVSSTNTSSKIHTDLTNSSPTTNDTTWFKNCVISHSPTGEILVIANGPKAVFFIGKSELHGPNSKMYYRSCYQGFLSQEQGEVITCVSCIPLVSKKRSSTGSPDWTCIAIGFSRGFVRFYSDTGNLLFQQQFHNERIYSFKVRSFVQSFLTFQHNQIEEFIIMHRSVIATVNGYDLCTTLRACLSNVARMKANVAEGRIEPPPLTYKKWGFETQQTISECDAIGLVTPTTFDHLVTASILGGPTAKPQKYPPTATIFLTTGRKPFLQFNYAQETQENAIITDIAVAVASKVKSSLIGVASGWLGLGGNSASAAAPQNPNQGKSFEAPTPLFSRFSIPDQRRQGESLITSPDRNLSAVTDKFGRIILVDNSLGIAIRMWKGYRDAECSWLTVEDRIGSRSKSQGPARKALFLVIYEPRKKRLEVFAMQQGPRVASFTLQRPGRLLSATYGMLGMNNVPISYGTKGILETLFIDADGYLFTLSIPFHLGLCDTASSKIKDLHVLKSLQKLLRQEVDSYGSDTILELLSQLKTQPLVNQSIKILTQRCNNHLLFGEVLNLYIQTFCEDGTKDLSVAFRVNALLELYSSFIASKDAPPIYAQPRNEDEERSLLYCLHASDKEIAFLQRLDASETVINIGTKTKAVKFQGSDEQMSIAEFFSSLVIDFDHKPKSIASLNKSSSLISPAFDAATIDDLGNLLFCGCLNGTLLITEWSQKVINAGIEPIALIKLLIRYWCENVALSKSYVGLMEKLYHIIRALCDVKGLENVLSNFNQGSTWWEEVRKELITLPKIFQIYAFSIVCRAVAIDLQQTIEKEMPSPAKGKQESMQMVDVPETEKSKVVECSGFENVSFDLLKWNVILKQIEDLSILSSVLSENPKLESPALPILKCQIEDLTVIKLMDKGKGCVAELVGKWLATIGIAPELISSAFEEERIQDAVDKSQKSSTCHEEDPIVPGIEAVYIDSKSSHVLNLLKTLKENFPVSLSSSIILSNYCWEYCLEWKNETNLTQHLDCALRCAQWIISPQIRQGMLSMIWNIFLNKKFSSTVAISKTGGITGKLADRPSGFSSPETKLHFLECVLKFFELSLETLQHTMRASKSMNCGVSADKSRTAVKNHWSNESTANNMSLTDLALIQPSPNFEMLWLHYELALVSLFFFTFRLKGTLKPTNLFDTQSKNMFFQKLQTSASETKADVDSALKQRREQFLCAVIAGAIKAIREEPGTAPTNSELILQQVVPVDKDMKELEEWIEKVMELGRAWGISTDMLRITYILELYSRGLDSYGSEEISSIYDREALGTKLLNIAGLRMNYLLEHKRENFGELVSSISTNLHQWIYHLDYTKLLCLRFTKESISELATQILQLIPDSSYDYKLAFELLQSIEFL